MKVVQMPKPVREKKPYDAVAVILTVMLATIAFALLGAGVVASVKLLIKVVTGG